MLFGPTFSLSVFPTFYLFLTINWRITVTTIWRPETSNFSGLEISSELGRFDQHFARERKAQQGKKWRVFPPRNLNHRWLRSISPLCLCAWSDVSLVIPIFIIPSLKLGSETYWNVLLKWSMYCLQHSVYVSIFSNKCFSFCKCV